MTDFVVIYVTVPNKELGKKIASALVKEKLAACVNIIPSINSIYQWKDEICDDEELLLIIKSRKELFPKVEERVKSLHSYDVAEVIALPIVAGAGDYLKWLKDETSGS